jgi:small-conductance mechanosensitive channel
MNNMNENIDLFFAWLNSINQSSILLQIGIVLVSLIVASLTSRQLGRKILGVGAQQPSQPGFKKLTFSTVRRILFPLTASLLVLVSLGILVMLEQPVKLLNIAISLLLSLAGIRLVVFFLRKGFTATPLLKAWENIISTLIWVVVALYLLDWLPAVTKAMDSFAFKVGATRISVLSIFNFIVLSAVLFTLAMWLSNYVERRVRASKHLNASLQVGLAKFLKFFLIALAILVALDAVGINLTALTVFGGALGVGLGFGLQRITSNFISGFILLFDRSIKPGDVISIGDKFGWVQELRARYIVVMDRDGVETLIPNENLVTTDVINWSYSNPNVRLKIPVSISYGDDPEKALGLLSDAANNCMRVLQDPPPAARLMEFGDNGIHLELRIWISDPQNGITNVRSDLNLAIWRLFKQAGITIPFPQRDVHVKALPPQPQVD